ncbi:hypothetical protein HYT05_02065 [Candidatus Kaiserbacteria bacterium]|nr:hypothetical protein [Candidatus Kaiserbacteria bacterium]
MKKMVLWLCATPIMLSAIWVVLNMTMLLVPAMLVVDADLSGPYTWLIITAFAIPFLVCVLFAGLGIIESNDINFIAQAFIWQVLLGYFVGVEAGFLVVWLGGAILIAFTPICKSPKPSAHLKQPLP